MAKKRGNNEGTIFKRSNGMWRAQTSANGKRISFSAKTRAECRQWLEEVSYQASQGINLEAGTKKLQKFLEEWLITVRSSRRPSTVSIYKRVLKRHVFPTLGSVQVKQINPEQIQSLYAKKLADGFSDHAVHQIHQVLHVAFEHALNLRLLPRNPVSYTSPPTPKSTEMSFYDEGEVQTLLLTAQGIGDHYYPIYYLAVHTGMRQGELLGLKWNDLDWKRQTLSITRQLVYRRGGVFEFREPKTKNGKRTILLGKAAIDILREHQDNQNLQRRRKATAWQEHGLMFASTTGTPINPSNLRRSFRVLLKESGLPKIRFHDLRHTAASLMLNNGIPVLIVSRRLGHSKPSITLDVYGHLIPSKQEEVVQLMDEILTPIALPVAPELHQKR